MRQWHILKDGAHVPGRRVIGFAPQRIVRGEPPKPVESPPALWAGHQEADKRWPFPWETDPVAKR